MLQQLSCVECYHHIDIKQSTSIFNRRFKYYSIPYPCAKGDPKVTLRNSSTCLDKGAAPDNNIRTRPPNACFIYQ